MEPIAIYLFILQLAALVFIVPLLLRKETFLRPIGGFF
jgi:hypothetical protein